MSRVLLFHSPNVAELIKVKEKDGSIVIGDKKFWIEEIPGLKEKIDKEGEIVRVMLKTHLGYEPLYFLKWDSIYPGKINFKNISLKDIEKKEELLKLKGLVEGTPEKEVHLASLIFHRDVKNIPESLYRSETLKIAGGMFKIKRELKGFLPFIFGVIIGVLVFYLMFYFKIIKI
ncbi:MAG: hypothetical protein QW795_03505 [Candidatus Bathyarchaeia archaeon]